MLRSGVPAGEAVPVVKTHAAPAPPLSEGPPTMAVLPSAERDTDQPWLAFPTAPDPTSLVNCCNQTPPLLVQIHTAPTTLLSKGPPTIAVLPSAEMDTEVPCSPCPTPSDPTSFVPCWVQAPSLLVKTHAAPTRLLSWNPPTTAVLPSPDRATDQP